MAGDFKLDTREWNRALNQLATTTKRDAPDFLNGQAFKVAIEALRHTHHASKSKVERELGQVATKVRLSTSRKTGAKSFRSAGRVVQDDSLASRILVKRFRETGSWGVKGGDMAKRAINLIAARVKSINFIRAGWIGAIRKLEPALKRRPRVSRTREARVHGVLKGGAIPAVNGLTSFVEIFNTALTPRVKEPSKAGKPLPVAQAGLQRAFTLAAMDMQQEFERRMQPNFQAVSVR